MSDLDINKTSEPIQRNPFHFGMNSPKKPRKDQTDESELQPLTDMNLGSVSDMTPDVQKHDKENDVSTKIAGLDFIDQVEDKKTENQAKC